MMRNIVLLGSSGLISREIQDLKNPNVNLIRIGRDLSSSDFRHDIVKSDLSVLIEHLQTFGKIDSIINTVAQPAVWRSWKDPTYDLETNALAGIRLIELAKALNSTNVVHFSSEAVYGDAVYPNELAHHRPTNPYGVSKLTADNYTKILSKEQVKLTILRPSFVLSRYTNRNVIYDLLSSKQKTYETPLTPDSVFNFVSGNTVAIEAIRATSSVVDFTERNVTGIELRLDELPSIIFEATKKVVSLKFGNTKRIASLSSVHKDVGKTTRKGIIDAISKLHLNIHG